MKETLFPLQTLDMGGHLTGGSPVALAQYTGPFLVPGYRPSRIYKDSRRSCSSQSRQCFPCSRSKAYLSVSRALSLSLSLSLFSLPPHASPEHRGTASLPETELNRACHRPNANTQTNTLHATSTRRWLLPTLLRHSNFSGPECRRVPRPGRSRISRREAGSTSQPYRSASMTPACHKRTGLEPPPCSRSVEGLFSWGNFPRTPPTRLYSSCDRSLG